MGTSDKVSSFIARVLLPSTKKALDYLNRQKWLEEGWYLAGGTALALQFGHRQSADLDFFTGKKEFDTQLLIRKIQNNSWKTTLTEKMTVYGELFGAKVSFIGYPQFKPAKAYGSLGSVRILDASDIAVMKIIAISQRGRKRDFYDMYWYTSKKEPLIQPMKRISLQYPHLSHNYHHILKSLTYFDDAEADPDPVIFFDASWKKVKEYFLREVPKIGRKILKLE